MNKVSTALISVTDKGGIVEFARSLEGLGIEILSTGGTARTIRDGGIKVLDISEYTAFPEMMDGRVKTLHPKVHGGLLGRRDNQQDIQMMRIHGIKDINMVVVNLYQFEQTISREGCTLEEAVENIDIGGPSMLRSAAKNFRYVTVIADPSDYPKVLKELTESGQTTLETRFELAKKAFNHTWQYDRAISDYLEGVEL
ncbi:MAG: IMP cyclohydrolase [Deltaproteobacteria bacterium]|jgi:phosphoribosylaminoimidazolecarboxamide formyltransferase/IMP cyclohydrolase|nr:MAG: IMP cyclohydrolase [Deltaproteobacteria bacterium]